MNYKHLDGQLAEIWISFRVHLPGNPVEGFGQGYHNILRGGLRVGHKHRAGQIYLSKKAKGC